MWLFKRAPKTVRPPTPPRRGRRGPRAWLLLEVTVGGVMASVIMADLLTDLGDASDRSTYVGRKVTAKMLAEQKIEQARGTIYGSLAEGTTTEVVTLSGKYTRTTTITESSVTTGFDGLAVLYFKEVRVTVTFGSSPVRTITTATRVYQGV